MALTFIYGNAGCGKSGYLYNKILKEAAADRKKRFFLIVPQQASLRIQQEIVRRSKNHVIMNIDVVSFERLAYRVFDELGKNEIVLEDTGKSLILRRIALAHEQELTVLRRNIRRPGAIDALKSMLSEFMQYNVRPEDLRDLCGKLPSSSELHYKIADLALLYEAFLAYLQQDMITGELLLKRLIDLAPESVLLKDAVLAFDGFTGFTPVQNELMKTFMDLASDLYVTVTFDRTLDLYGANPAEDLFYMSRKMVQTLSGIAREKHIPYHGMMLADTKKTRFAGNAQLRHLEANLFRPGAKPYEDGMQSAGSASGKDSEPYVGSADDEDSVQSGFTGIGADDAVSQHGRAADSGDPDSIRLFSCTTAKDELEQAAALIAEMVRDRKSKLHYRDFAVISANVKEHQKYAEAVFAKYDIPYFVDSRRDLLYHPLTECLRAALQVVQTDFKPDAVFRFLRTGLTDLTARQTDELENFVRARGIRGFSKWNKDFAWPAAKMRRVRGEEMKERLAEQLSELNTQRESIVSMLASLYALRSGEHTVLTLIRTLYDLLTDLRAEEKLHAFAGALEEQERMEEASLQERIYPIVMDLFDKFAELLGPDRITLKEFSELLEAGLDGIKIGVVPPGNDTVILGDMERTRVEGVRYLLFLGLNDGQIPKKRDDGSILSQYDRQILSKMEITLAPTEREEIFQQRFYLYWILTKPTDGIFLFCANIGADGKSLRPSYLIGTMKQLFPALDSETAGIVKSFTPANSMDVYVRGLQDTGKGVLSPEFTALHQWYTQHEPWRTQVRRLADAAFYHAPQYALPAHTARDLYGSTMVNSVTRLEKFAQCAFAHFLSYGLRLREREEFSFEAVDLGTLYHDVLMRYSQEADRRYDWAVIAAEHSAALLEECIRQTREMYADSPLLDTARGRYRFSLMESVLATSVHVITEQIRRGEYRPALFEAEFAQTKALPDGARMRLTGKIDRLDVYRLPDEETLAMRIVDYKSGSRKFSYTEFYNGLQMQLVTYVNAAAAVLKRDPAVKNVRPGGFFYLHLDDPVFDLEQGALEEQLLRSMRLDGLFSSDPDLYRPMDRSMKKTSFVIPLSLNKDGSISARGTGAVSDYAIQNLCDYADKKSLEAASGILQGHIAAEPYRLGTKKGCDYCPYHSVCGFDVRLPGYGYHRIESESGGEILEQIREELRQGAAPDRGQNSNEGLTGKEGDDGHAMDR